MAIKSGASILLLLIESATVLTISVISFSLIKTSNVLSCKVMVFI
jgi:hypothetical protein